MLKTNSKKAAENIRRYIMDNFTAENYTDTPPTEWHEIAVFIYGCFRSENGIAYKNAVIMATMSGKPFTIGAPGCPLCLILATSIIVRPLRIWEIF